jgi:hypothetical protein
VFVFSWLHFDLSPMKTITVTGCFALAVVVWLAGTAMPAGAPGKFFPTGVVALEPVKPPQPGL